MSIDATQTVMPVGRHPLSLLSSDKPVIGARLARHMHLSAPSITEALRRMQEDMDRAFSQILSGQFGEARGAGPSQPQWSPSIDVSETPTEWCVEADLPGAPEVSGREAQAVHRQRDRFARVEHADPRRLEFRHRNHLRGGQRHRQMAHDLDVVIADNGHIIRDAQTHRHAFKIGADRQRGIAAEIYRAGGAGPHEKISLAGQYS